MSWEITMLFVHISALAGALMLYRKAPCWMQGLVIVLLSFAMAGFVAAQLAVMNEMVWEAGLLRRVAFEVEHVAFLLWIFRVNYQDRVQWTSSAYSRK